MSQLNRWTIPQLWDFATGFGGFVFLGGGGRGRNSSYRRTVYNMY